MKQIFPKEIIEHTTQYFIPKNTVKSKLIYGLILFLFISAITALPFISISIFTSARGLIKPSKDRMSLTSINSGKVIFNTIENNKMVTMGDTLLVLQTSVLDEQLILNTRKIKIINSEIKDLKNIISDKKPAINYLETPKYKKEIIQYNARLTEHYTKLRKLKVDFKRNSDLLSKGVIARVEFEESKLALDLANNALNQFQKSAVNSWQANLSESENLFLELENNIEQVSNNKNSYVVTAPINGTLINTTSLNDGSFITSGAMLGEITPDTELIVECYISPKDIGLIDSSKDVSFQIDAFNYNQWGLASGKIKRIGEDVEFMDNQPFYKIQCILNENYLQLKNGYQRELGKGMTLNARFEITERTLYELLYDKMDDWLNPGNGKDVAQNN